jgi:ATP-binding cassette subfamily C protein CydD
MKPTSGSERPSNRAVLPKLSRKGGKELVAALALPVAAGLLLIVQMLALSDLLDRAIVRHVPLRDLWFLIATIAAILLVRALLLMVGERLASRASETIKLWLRNEMLGQILDGEQRWLRSRASGALAAGLVEQVEALEGYFSRFLPALVQATLLPLAFAAVVMPVDMVVGLLFLLTAPMIPLFMALVGWGAEAASNAQATSLARLSAYFGDRLRGLKTLLLFGRMDDEQKAMRRATEELRCRTQRVLRIAFMSSAVLEFFAALGVAGVALYVGLSYLDLLDLRSQPLTLASGLFCLLIAPEVYQPLRLLASHYHDRAQAAAALAEINRQFEAAAFPRIDQDPPQATALPFEPHSTASGLALYGNNVSLAAPGGGANLLVKAHLALAAGSRTALVGESGIGKSTLIMALAGLADVDGSITIADRPLHTIAEPDLGRVLTVIGQQPTLFSGSIAENIRFARPSASDDAVLAAARLACVTDFSDGMPEGLYTLVQDGGLGLSGGEAQRIALARLFLTDPKLILLDEPTAHLDPVTEQQVLDNIIAFARNRTLLLATHSPAVAERMDEILMFKDRQLNRMRGHRPFLHKQGRAA